MEEIITEILTRLRAGKHVDDAQLVKIIHGAARHTGADKRTLAKRLLWPYYQEIKANNPTLYESWHVTPELERALASVLRMKPRRSASGVATITVLTKPWPCGGQCIFCPSDVRCPKSYLADEPACARAEQNCYDPYLQISARLTALTQMGHATDKIELIVLGGTWTDYPECYRIWFVRELFRALNDNAVAGVAANPRLRGFAEDDYVRQVQTDVIPSNTVDRTLVPGEVARRHQFYRDLGLDPDVWSSERRNELDQAQRAINAHELTYNEAYQWLYAHNDSWQKVSEHQTATWEELECEQQRNEQAHHRVVGLVVETRPDALTPAMLRDVRRLGVTKVQIGVQSLDTELLEMNCRGINVDELARAFDLLRLFGFKIHAHFMANLLGATPERDAQDFEHFVHDTAFQPDEIKLYPCALIEGSKLCENYKDGSWKPYSENDLIHLLARDLAITPAWTRVSRVIRDFSTGDIVAGNKKPNLRQLVEQHLSDEPVQEIRFREVGNRTIDFDTLMLKMVLYETRATSERFLQWVTPDNLIAGFLRLSLPRREAVEALGQDAPVRLGEAMIREVHVYGAAERVGEEGIAPQHHGLGRALIERACALACEAGYTRINVISAVGTREYYRQLGFVDRGLYQQKIL